MNRAELLTAITNDTGLERATVRDLLKKGWVYVKTDGVAEFVSPQKKGN